MRKSTRIYLFVSVALGFLWILFSFVLYSNFNSEIRLFNDNYDKNIYFSRAKWFSNNRIPYLEVFSEYPQIATYLFAIPNVIWAIFYPGTYLSSQEYNVIFSTLMLLLMAATIFLLVQILPLFKKHYAYLMFLPAPLYFSINRFDILPAFLCLLAYRSIRKGGNSFAAFLLAIGTFTKWYPVLLFPAFLYYEDRTNRRLPLRSLFVFCITCLLILLPTYLTGGLDAILVPYSFHADRTLEFVSMPALINLAFTSIGFPLPIPLLKWFFLALQLSGLGIVMIWKRPRNYQDLLQANILIISSFILFARIYSPQWILWIFPFLVLSIRNKIDVVFLILYSIQCYIGFPVLFDTFRSDALMYWLGAINLVFLTIIMLIAFLRLQHAGRKSRPM